MTRNSIVVADRLSETTVRGLEQQLNGVVVRPGDAAYERARLASVKRRNDPGNVFRLNANIPPA